MAKIVFEKELSLRSSFRSTTSGPIMDGTVVPRESFRRRKDALESQTTTLLNKTTLSGMWEMIIRRQAF